MTSQSPRSVTVEVVSDAICPWCFIGKRRLEGAAALLRGGIGVDILWKPFELNPDMPKGGVPRPEYRLRKFGSLEFSEQLDARVAEAGRATGIGFRHDLMTWTPNTFDCHRLIWFAGRAGRQEQIVEGLFRAYFIEGRNIGDPDVMIEIAAGGGLDRADVKNLLAGSDGAEDVARELARARSMGIGAVPAFVIEGEPLISGAAPSELIAAEILEAAARKFGG